MSKYNFKAMDEFVMFGGYGDWYHISDEARERLHEEKLALPTFGEEAKAARERNIARVKNRKNKLK